MGRAPCCEKVGLNRGAWTREEDLKLIQYITSHGEGSWRTLPKAAGLLRCGKSCRLRWINYLRPDLKRGNITEDEDRLIIKLHSVLGNRWSLIAGRLPGRTDNEIKNYWNTHLKKKLKNMGIDPCTHQPLLLIQTAHTNSNITTSNHHNQSSNNHNHMIGMSQSSIITRVRNQHHHHHHHNNNNYSTTHNTNISTLNIDHPHGRLRLDGINHSANHVSSNSMNSSTLLSSSTSCSNALIRNQTIMPGSTGNHTNNGAVYENHIVNHNNHNSSDNNYDNNGATGVHYGRSSSVYTANNNSNNILLEPQADHKNYNTSNLINGQTNNRIAHCNIEGSELAVDGNYENHHPAAAAANNIANNPAAARPLPIITHSFIKTSNSNDEHHNHEATARISSLYSNDSSTPTSNTNSNIVMGAGAGAICPADLYRASKPIFFLDSATLQRLRSSTPSPHDTLHTSTSYNINHSISSSDCGRNSSNNDGDGAAADSNNKNNNMIMQIISSSKLCENHPDDDMGAENNNICDSLEKATSNSSSVSRINNNSNNNNDSNNVADPNMVDAHMCGNNNLNMAPMISYINNTTSQMNDDRDYLYTAKYSPTDQLQYITTNHDNHNHNHTPNHNPNHNNGSSPMSSNITAHHHVPDDGLQPTPTNTCISSYMIDPSLPHDQLYHSAQPLSVVDEYGLGNHISNHFDDDPDIDQSMTTTVSCGSVEQYNGVVEEAWNNTNSTSGSSSSTSRSSTSSSNCNNCGSNGSINNGYNNKEAKGTGNGDQIRRILGYDSRKIDEDQEDVYCCGGLRSDGGDDGHDHNSAMAATMTTPSSSAAAASVLNSLLENDLMMWDRLDAAMPPPPMHQYHPLHQPHDHQYNDPSYYNQSTSMVNIPISTAEEERDSASMEHHHHRDDQVLDYHHRQHHHGNILQMNVLQWHNNYTTAPSSSSLGVADQLLLAADRSSPYINNHTNI